MHHGITESEWFEFLEDTLPAAERVRVLAHLKGCEECRQLHRDIRVWEGIVQDEARRLVSALDRSPEEIDWMAANALDQIRRCEPRDIAVPGFRFGEGVLLLRALLDPLCGTGAARNAVRLATEQSCEPGSRVMQQANWSIFVRNLGAAIGAVYGVPARILIERVGRLVGAEVQ